MTTRPPFDPELEALLQARPYLSKSIHPRHIPALRESLRAGDTRVSDDLLRRSGAIDFEERDIPSSDPSVRTSLLVLRPSGVRVPRAGMCFIHGGGMISGDNRTGIEVLLDWVVNLGIVVASIDYRLAPEHPYPVPLEDCYAALGWLAANRSWLGFDAQPLILAGSSAGGGLAAGVAMLARDRQGPALSDLVLMSPMLDDAAAFRSSTELESEGVWDRQSNHTAWQALLGDRHGTADLPAYAAPSRQQQLAQMPATYLDVGAVETFRDEVIDFGARLAQAGVSLEMHVWAGAFHGFDMLAPDSAVARIAGVARIDYLRRRLRGRAAA